jgi:2-iminobutanoate/2-iminopropanoate deaminase
MAINPEGKMEGDDIASQTLNTLRNCERQLRTAGCELGNVFKCNIYMKDLSEWEAMNAVYAEIMPEPRPARTAVQAFLLNGALIEIEMWAVKA